MWGKRGENEKKCVCVCVCESISWNDTFILLLSHRPLFPVPLLCCLKSISPSDPISRIFSLFSFLTVRDRIIYQPVWLSGRYLAVLVPTQAINNLILRGVFRCFVGALLFWGTENRPTQNWSKVNGAIFFFYALTSGLCVRHGASTTHT